MPGSCIILAEILAMRKHRFINDPHILLKQEKEIVTKSTDSKFIYRSSMVNRFMNCLLLMSLERIHKRLSLLLVFKYIFPSNL